MLTNKMKKTKESGMTLIETLIVITIGLVFVALALTVYGSDRDKNNVRNETENISLIYNQTMDLFSNDTLDKFDTKKAVEIGIMPKKMKVLGGTVKNAWGGEVTVTGAAQSTLTLTTARVPAGSICIDLLINQAEVGWTDYDVGGKGGAFEEMTVSDLFTNCSGSGTKTIEFKYDSGGEKIGIGTGSGNSSDGE